MKYIRDKGRGVFATQDFHRGEFVVEYSGELIDIQKAYDREEQYEQDENTGCYMYYFKFRDQHYWYVYIFHYLSIINSQFYSSVGNLIFLFMLNFILYFGITDQKPLTYLSTSDFIKIFFQNILSILHITFTIYV